MDYQQLRGVLSTFKGATFASLDTVTQPKPGITKTVTGTSVVLFSNVMSSGYESMVRRRLAKAGIPSDFTVGDLPWGSRIDNLPLIENHGQIYLQTVVLRSGEAVFTATSGRVVDPEVYGIRERPRSIAALPKGQQIHVSTYRLDHITRIALLGLNEDLTL